jgi:hypothetical protein
MDRKIPPSPPGGGNHKEGEGSRDHGSNSSTAQRARLLAYLLVYHSITTFGARRDLDIPHPAARVQELRRAGHRLVTEWTREEATSGRPAHRIARYVLLGSTGGAQ